MITIAWILLYLLVAVVLYVGIGMLFLWIGFMVSRPMCYAEYLQDWLATLLAMILSLGLAYMVLNPSLFVAAWQWFITH